MAGLSVIFRGVFGVSLGSNAARIIMPGALRPQFASGFEQRVLPAHYYYIAIHEKALKDPFPRPHLTCAMQPYDHAPGRVDLSAQFTRWGLRQSTTLRRESIDLREDDGPRYHIYFLSDDRIDFGALQSASASLQYDFAAVDDKAPPDPEARSMQWLPSLRQVAPNAVLDSRIHDAVPSIGPIVYSDITRGVMQPRFNASPHVLRFAHSGSTIRRPLAEEVLIEGEPTVAASSITTSSRTKAFPPKRFELTHVGEIDVIVGNEPLEDILGLAQGGTCADLAYHVELLYRLCTSVGAERYPVPYCINEHDGHRDHPRVNCGPPLRLA